MKILLSLQKIDSKAINNDTADITREYFKECK